MAITVAHILSSGDNVDRAAYTTASITLQPGESILVGVTPSVTTTAQTVTSVTGSSTMATLDASWQNLGNVLMNSSGRARTTLLYVKNTGASAVSGTLTFNLSGTASSCQWTALRLTGAAVNPLTGANGAPVTLQTTVANPSVDFPNTPASDSAIIAFLHSNDTANAITAGAGFTAVGTGFNAASPVAKHQGEYDLTPVDTVAFTVAGVFNRGLIGVEIAAAPTATAPPPRHPAYRLLSILGR